MKPRTLYKRELSAKWLAKGLCRNCGARAHEPNRKQCANCLKIARNVTRRVRARKPDAFKLEYHARVEAGICANCGVPGKPLVTGRLCGGCSLAERQRGVRVKAAVMLKYGGRCACPPCGETCLAFLTLDHIHNDGAQMRRSGLHSGGGHFYKRLLQQQELDPALQVLCYNCNLGKRVSGVCPHLDNSFVEAALARGRYGRQHQETKLHPPDLDTSISAHDVHMADQMPHSAE